MLIAPAIIVGLVAGVLSAVLSHRRGWKAGVGAALVYTAAIGLLASTTDVSFGAILAALLAFAVPGFVDDAHPAARRAINRVRTRTS